MGIIKNMFNSVKSKWIVKRELKNNGFNRKQFEEKLKEWQNRSLDIEEILSRENSDNVIVDTYEYCMRKCDWEPSNVSDGPVKEFLLCVLFQTEVENGGIVQFLLNSSGDLTSETIEAIKKVDGKYADVLTAIAQFFPRCIVPKDRKNRMDIMDSFDEETVNQIDELDRCVFDNDYTQKLYDYIHNHKVDFLNF